MMELHGPQISCGINDGITFTAPTDVQVAIDAAVTAGADQRNPGTGCRLVAEDSVVRGPPVGGESKIGHVDNVALLTGA